MHKNSQSLALGLGVFRNSKVLATKRISTGSVDIRAVQDTDCKKWRIALLPDGALVSMTEGRLVDVLAEERGRGKQADVEVRLGPKVCLETLDRITPKDLLPDNTLEERYSLVANMIAKTSGIVVKQDHSLSCPSAWFPGSRVIKLRPNLPECYDALFAQVLNKAKLFHELSHVIFTKHEKAHQAKMAAASNPKLFATVANILEDGRIERLFKRAFPGAEPYLRAKAAELALATLKGHVLNDLKARMYLDRYLTDKGREIFTPHEALIRAAIGSQSSKEVWEAAAVLTEAIAKQMPPVKEATRCWGITGEPTPKNQEPQAQTKKDKKEKKEPRGADHVDGCSLYCMFPQDDGDDGDGADGNSEGDQESLPVKHRFTHATVEDKDDGDDGDADSDGPDADKGGDDGGGKDAAGEDQDGDDDDGHDAGGHGKDGDEGDDITDPDLRKAWDDLKRLKQEAYDQVRADVTTEVDELKEEDLERTNEIQDLLESEESEAQELAEVLRAWKIEAKRDKYRTVRHGGSFDPRRQTQALTDQPANRSRRDSGEFDFDSVVVLDDSGSMDEHRKYDIAASVSRILVAALRKARLLTKPCLLNRGFLPTVPLTTYAGGGRTPTDLALRQARVFLEGSPARRKVVFLVTDGAPDSLERAHDEWLACDEAGITVFGIGIGSGVTPEALEQQCHLPLIVQDVADIRDALPRLLLDFAEEEVYA